MRRFAAFLGVALVLSLLASTFVDRSARGSEPAWMKYRTGRQPVVGLGEPELAREQYETWKASTADPYVVEFASTNLLDQPELASGWFRIDYQDERLVAEIRGLVEEPMDLWLIDNPADSPAVVDAEDAALWIGEFEYVEGVAVLDAPVADITAERFEIDLAVVTPKGVLPHEGGLLHGAPDLFQRLYALEERMALEAEQRTERMLALAAVS